jgi:hypothetical protein
LPDDLFGEVSLPETPAALPRRLGSFPFWRGKDPFLEALEPVYLKAAATGLYVLVGLPKPQAAEDPAPDKLIMAFRKVPKTGKAKPWRGLKTLRKSSAKKKTS